MLLHRADPIPDDGLADPTRWPDHTLIPFDDAASRAILDHALTCLILVRGGNLHDPGATCPVTWPASARHAARL